MKVTVFGKVTRKSSTKNQHQMTISRQPPLDRRVYCGNVNLDLYSKGASFKSTLGYCLGRTYVNLPQNPRGSVRIALQISRNYFLPNPHKVTNHNLPILPEKYTTSEVKTLLNIPSINHLPFRDTWFRIFKLGRKQFPSLFF